MLTCCVCSDLICHRGYIKCKFAVCALNVNNNIMCTSIQQYTVLSRDFIASYPGSQGHEARDFSA